MAYFVNYQASDYLPASDRGLAYGDGLFETLHVRHAQVLSWSMHLQRLLRGCRKLSIDFPRAEQQQLSDFIHSLAQQNLAPHVIKIVLTRGSGGRGYVPPQAITPTIVISTALFPDYSHQASYGIKVGFSPIPTNTNAWLAGIKHLNRLENVLAKTHLSSNCFEDVMLDAQGHVIECIQSNLFWFKQGVLYTPLLHKSGVQGTMRTELIQKNTQFPLVCGLYKPTALLEADEIFVANSLMGIVPVITLAGRAFPIGDNTRKLQVLMSVFD